MRSQTLELQALLSIPDLSKTPLVAGYQTSDGSDVQLEPSPRYILLETWELAFERHDPETLSDRLRRQAQGKHPDRQEQGLYSPTESVSPAAAMYKQCIPIFRALFTLLRTLPAWQINKKFEPRQSKQKQLGMKLRIRPTGGADKYENLIRKLGQLLYCI